MLVRQIYSQSSTSGLPLPRKICLMPMKADPSSVASSSSASLGPARGGIGNNPSRSREHNRRVLLDLLRQHGPLGRKELAAGTQLSAPAVANILDDLVQEGLLLDLGRKPSGRGQPPLHFALNPKGAHTLGFEIGVNGIITTALDLVGKPIVQHRLQNASLTPSAAISLLRAEIEALKRTDNGPLLGIGVVMPGPFRAEGLSGIGPTTLPGWEDVTPEGFSEALDAPVWMENDANAAALTEALFGQAAHLHDVVVLYFGYGVGLGVISAGRLLRGTRGNAGEVGHIVVAPGGRSCSCGQQGCFERYVSRHALSEALGQSLSPGSVGKLWQAQDPRLLEWITEAGKHLSPMVTLIENMLDPDTIILAGQFPAPVMEALIAATRLGPSVAAVKDRSLPRLQTGHASAFSASLGAAALPLYGAMTPHFG